MGDLQESLTQLIPEPDSALLIDVVGQTDAVKLVQLARSLGWQHVVVIASNRQWMDALAVLQAGASTYRMKTNSVPEGVQNP